MIWGGGEDLQWGKVCNGFSGPLQIFRGGEVCNGGEGLQYNNGTNLQECLEWTEICPRP